MVSRKIPKVKGFTFEEDIKLNAFLSVFSVLSYIFENKKCGTELRLYIPIWLD